MTMMSLKSEEHIIHDKKYVTKIVTSATFIHREMCLLDIMFQCQDVFTMYNVHVCVFVCT